MRTKLPIDLAQAEALLPPRKPDGSGVGLNYLDALLKPIKLTLEDGRKLTVKRRGLKITLSLGDRIGEGLLRRLQNGPEMRTIVHEGLQEAARAAGASFIFQSDGVYLEG